MTSKKSNRKVARKVSNIVKKLPLPRKDKPAVIKGWIDHKNEVTADRKVEAERLKERHRDDKTGRSTGIPGVKRNPPGRKKSKRPGGGLPGGPKKRKK